VEGSILINFKSGDFFMAKVDVVRFDPENRVRELISENSRGDLSVQKS
jgi:hypothetical protein